MSLPNLNAAQVDLLNVLLETLIPAAPARGLPSAAKVGFVEFAAKKGIVPKVAAVLEGVARTARERHGVEFAALDTAARLALLLDRTPAHATVQAEVQNFLLQCYYQNPIVVSAIGMEPRAPFPDGYQVEEGDLLLLEPVFLKGKLYRDA